MDKLSDFDIEVDKVPTVDKSGQSMDEVDKVANEQGYVSREPQHTPKPKIRSWRTKQIHTWVLPRFKELLLAESRRRRVPQGMILEEALNLYEKQNPVVKPS